MFQSLIYFLTRAHFVSFHIVKHRGLHRQYSNCIRPANNSCLSGSLNQSSKTFSENAGFFNIVVSFFVTLLWEKENENTLKPLLKHSVESVCIKLLSWQKVHKDTLPIIINSRQKCVNFAKSFQFTTKVRDFWQIISAIHDNFLELGSQDPPLFARLRTWLGLILRGQEGEF